MAAAVCLVGAIFIAQIPWNHALGLLGLLMLATALLAAGAWGLKSRVPLLRSDNLLLTAGAWGVISGLLLITALLSLTGPSSLLPSRHGAGQTASPYGRAAVPSPVVLAPAPTPTTISVATPRVTPTPTPAAVTFLEASLSAQRGQTVTLRVRTAPESECTIEVGYPSAPDLDDATSDGVGNVSWSWRVGEHVQSGIWPITVSCSTGTASTQISVS